MGGPRKGHPLHPTAIILAARGFPRSTTGALAPEEYPPTESPCRRGLLAPKRRKDPHHVNEMRPHRKGNSGCFGNHLPPPMTLHDPHTGPMAASLGRVRSNGRARISVRDTNRLLVAGCGDNVPGNPAPVASIGSFRQGRVACRAGHSARPGSLRKEGNSWPEDKSRGDKNCHLARGAVTESRKTAGPSSRTRARSAHVTGGLAIRYGSYLP